MKNAVIQQDIHAAEDEERIEVVIEPTEIVTETVVYENEPHPLSRQNKIALTLCVVPTIICTLAGATISLMLLADAQNNSGHQNDLIDLGPLLGTFAGGAGGLAFAGLYRYGSSVSSCVSSFFCRGNPTTRPTEPENHVDYQPVRQTV